MSRETGFDQAMADLNPPDKGGGLSVDESALPKTLVTGEGETDTTPARETARPGAIGKGSVPVDEEVRREPPQEQAREEERPVEEVRTAPEPPTPPTPPAFTVTQEQWEAAMSELLQLRVATAKPVEPPAPVKMEWEKYLEEMPDDEFLANPKAAVIEALRRQSLDTIRMKETIDREAKARLDEEVKVKESVKTAFLAGFPELDVEKQPHLQPILQHAIKNTLEKSWRPGTTLNQLVPEIGAEARRILAEIRQTGGVASSTETETVAKTGPNFGGGGAPPRTTPEKIPDQKQKMWDMVRH